MVELSEDLIDPPEAEEIAISPSGDYAFIRQFGSNHIVVLDLLTREVSRIPVGSVPTDLDLSPDGTQAAVVARGSHELYVFDVQDPFGPVEVFDLPQEELLGSLQFSPDASKAILYTSAAPLARFTTWDVVEDEFTIRGLEKPVKSVKVSPDGGTLTIFHPKTNAEDADPNSVFKDKDALTMVDLDDFRSNALLLPKEPSAFVNSHDGRFGYFIMEGSPYLEVLLYDALLYDEIKLKSDPVHVGVLPESTYAYVNQEHDLGRLSFYEPDEGVVKTITGFELNSGIEH
jgi:DNA-binding beta-propeller fold protein YncE